MKSFTEKVLELVPGIPKGKVMTYKKVRKYFNNAKKEF